MTTQKTVRRLDQLQNVGDEHTTRFASIEPQWESIDLGDRLPRLSWVIQGGMSGSTAYPFDVEWADAKRQACRKAQVPYFLKQLGWHVVEHGRRIRFVDRHGGDWTEWPERLRVRQMPIKGF